jgi:putative ABC transport system permease protein
MPSLLQDLRFARRVLVKNPGFTATAALTLALGIGSTSAVFSLVQGVLLTPPPYRDPERLILITPARTDGQPYSRNWTAEQFLDFQKGAKSFDAVAAYDWTFDFLTLPDGSESIGGLGVSKDYFKVIGINPLLGREFLENEAPVKYWEQTAIILGYNLWQRRFNGDRGILGKTVHLGIFDKSLTVVGVMPPGVRFLPSPSNAHEPNYDINAHVDFWVPVRPDPAKAKESWCSLFGRLRADVTLAQAGAELSTITARQAESDRELEGLTAKAEQIAQELNHEGRRLLLPLFGAVTLVFLIACGNVSGLLLARGLQRRYEYAVRSALGARRIQLFRQALTESLLLAVPGGVLGIGLGLVTVKVLKAIAGHAIPRLDAVMIGWPVLSFGFGSALLAAALAGVVPALRVSQLNPARGLEDTRTSSLSRRERQLLGGLTMLQTALTLALLAGAFLLIRTVNNLARLNPGYNTRHMLTMNVTDVRWGNYFDFHERALERLSALPGVKNVAFAWGLPLTGDNWVSAIEIEGQPRGGKFKDQLRFPTRSVTPNYFEMLGQKLVAGRNFLQAHSSATNRIVQPQVAIINEAMVERYFPGANPIGKRLRYAGQKEFNIEIIGVVANARTEDLTRRAEPEIYYSFWEAMMRTKRLVVQTESDPRRLIATVQRELRAIQPTLAIENVKTLEQIRSDSVASQSFAMRLLVGFSLVASALALVGIYGVLSLSVGSRNREIAIRVALGAQRNNVLRLVLGEGLRLVVFGLLLGVGAAVALGQVLRAFLFEVQPSDPVTLIVGAALFATVALMACYIPARRATNIDPMKALRYE